MVFPGVFFEGYLSNLSFPDILFPRQDRSLFKRRQRLDLHDRNPKIFPCFCRAFASCKVRISTECFILQEVTKQQERKTAKQSTKINDVNKPDIQD